MTSLRTIEGFQETLDRELAWRIQELSCIKTAVKFASGNQQKGLIRSGITMLYAHWEGFVKQASEKYLEFIDKKALKYSELQTSFVALGLRKKLHELSATKQHRLRVEILDYLFTELNTRAAIGGKSAIDTKANLNSETFGNILCVVGVSSARYETKYKLIDESLLSRRNSIAHGEFLDVDQDQYFELSDEILALMRGFKTDLQNAVSLEAYRK